MEDFEVVCPSCGDPILLPRGDSNVFECPECSAGIDWNGKHIVGLRTDRNYIFPGSSEYETFFDADYLHEAVKFANEVMDNDAVADDVIGSGGKNGTVTSDEIQSNFDFSNNFRIFAGLLFIPAIIFAIVLVSQPDGWIGAVCCLGIPTLVMMVASTPSQYSGDDMSLANREGGAYRSGRGDGLTPDGRFLTEYNWKHETFNFVKFKEVSSEHRIKATTFYRGGGDHSSPSQGYLLEYFVGETKFIASWIFTTCHDYRRDHFLSDLDEILSIKNKIKTKSGVNVKIEIKFDYLSKFSMLKSRKKKAEIADWVNNDLEISSVWNKITES
ncbi:MAG: hypothetical protein ACPID5_05805 [Candidatus Poseidoniaceae archaeon]